jgi:LysR family transcriptional activator of glutamate synthase operon
METEVLRFFQQVADGATVTEVAELYQVSQPGVSRGLKRLEEEVGTPLLERSGRLLRITHAGSVFKRHVDAVLHALDDGLAAIEELIDPETGTVRVAFQLSLGTWFVPDVIAAFRKEHPRVRFHFEHSHDALGSSLVAEGRTDLEFTARRPRNPEVHWEWLFQQPLCLAIPPDHRLADRDEVALAEAAKEDFVMLRPAWELRTLSEELCTRAGFVPRVAFEEDDIPVVRGFVAAGLGVAIVPALAAEVRQAGGGAERLVRLSDAAAFREVGLAWSKNRRMLPSAELFRHHVLEGRQGGRRAVRRRAADLSSR